MYFPFLYDKQSELLAIRGLAGELGSPQRIVPLIEPVSAAGGLKRVHKAFKKSGDYAYVVENPHLLTLADPASIAQWRTDVSSLFSDVDVFRPTFKERVDTTVADITAFIARNKMRPVGLIVNSARIPSAAIAAAVRSSDSLVFLTAGADRVALTTALGAGRIVEINDRFPAQRINADYSGSEWFSRDHLEYTANGYPGFSDYTVLPSKPAKKSGGGAPGAVAIHLSFEHTDNTIWVEHFLSDETDQNVGGVGSKMLEAIAYINAEVLASTKLDASPALAEYLDIYAKGANSSLGNNKKLEIAHHIFAMGRRLGI